MTYYDIKVIGVISINSQVLKWRKIIMFCSKLGQPVALKMEIVLYHPGRDCGS